MSRDIGRRLAVLENAAPPELPLRARKWLGEQLTPAEEAQLAAEPEPGPMTAKEWDAMDGDTRSWFEARCERPSLDEGGAR
jgi:hypothetical protein